MEDPEEISETRAFDCHVIDRCLGKADEVLQIATARYAERASGNTEEGIAIAEAWRQLAGFQAARQSHAAALMGDTEELTAEECEELFGSE